MITKNDCLSLLVRLEDKDKGLNIDPYMKKLLAAETIPLEVLQFISQSQGLEVCNFYEMLRKKHNKHKSPLYINILKGSTNTQDTVIMLSCLLTQIVLYSSKLADATLFLKEIRAEEITRVLNNYFKTGSADQCFALAKLIKSDLLVLDYLNGRRDKSPQ